MPARCPEYWRLYFARDAAAANLAQVQAAHADGGRLHADVVYADSALAWALHLQTLHLHKCPVCLEWLEGLPDGDVITADIQELEKCESINL